MYKDPVSLSYGIFLHIGLEFSYTNQTRNRQ